jgi:amidohydrolase family protein
MFISMQTPIKSERSPILRRLNAQVNINRTVKRHLRTCWGFSLHEELELLVEQGGLQPAEALRTATIEPVLLMGLEWHFGTVEPGKTADLLILDSDPTENIHITQRIFAVIAGGRLFGRSIPCWASIAESIN